MKKNKKLVLLSILLALSTICLSFLIYNKPITTSCNITNDISQMLQYLNVDNCRITKLGNYKNISASISEITVSQNDVNKYIKTLLKDNSTSKEITYRTTVQKDDLVLLDYEIYYCDKKIQEDTNASILVGSNNFDSQIEQSLIGMKKNTMFEKKILLSSNYYTKKALLRGKVTSIKEIIPAKLTDAFVQENYDCNNIQEFNDYIYNILKNERETDEQAIAYNQILTEIIKNSKFNFDNEQMTKYSLKTVDGYVEIASLYDMDLEQYRKNILDVNEVQFFQMCYDETKKYVEEYLIIGAIAYKESLNITEKEIDKYLQDNNFSLEEKESSESMCYLKYQLLRKKVYNFILNNSTPSN